MDFAALKNLILFYKAQGWDQAQIGESLAEMNLNGFQEDAFDFLHEAFLQDLLPEIVLPGPSLREQTARVLEMLYACNADSNGIYQRSGDLVRITRDDEGRPIVEPLTEHAFRGRIERTCAFIRTGPKGRRDPVCPPMEVVRDCMALGDWEFPSLMGITEAPVLRSDGSALTTPGYDPKTRLYYAPTDSLEIADIPDEPSDLEVAEAITLLCEPFADFPFDSQASRTNALAAMLTPILRPMIEGPVPLTIIDKPQAGTGASLLAEVVSVVATGRPAAMMTAQNDDDSWRKAIVSLLVRGQQVAVIDNIESTLWAPSLAAVLTSSTYQDRILGRSEMVLLPNRVTWIGTGNNIRLAGDLPRRTVWVRLDAKQARPWMRNRDGFRHPNLIEWVTEHRGDILRAILTVARAWVVAGRPTAETVTLGGYESWVRVVGGVLAFMQEPGFLSNLEDLYAKVDTDTPQWEAFLEAWAITLRDRPVTVAQLVSYLNDDSDFAACLPDNVGDRNDKGFTRKLGKALAKREGVHFPNGGCITKGGTFRHAVTWIVSFDGQNDPNSHGFTNKCEFGEFHTTPARAQENQEISYGDGGEINSQNSQNSHETERPFDGF